MNAVTTQPGTETGVWVHGMKAVIGHAEAHQLPYPHNVATIEHPSGDLIVTVHLDRAPFEQWLATVHVLAEDSEYRNPKPGLIPPFYSVRARVLLPDTGVRVTLAGRRDAETGLHLVGGESA